MIVVIRSRGNSRDEKKRLQRQGELVTAHNKGQLGRHWYQEDRTGKATGTKGKPYLSPLKLRGKI